MIIPTADFDPLFADDGIPFGLKMCRYIQREFADRLGASAALLDTEAGLAIVSLIHSPENPVTASRKDAA